MESEGYQGQMALAFKNTGNAKLLTKLKKRTMKLKLNYTKVAAAGCGVLVMLFSACSSVEKDNQISQLQISKDSLGIVLHERDSLMNEMMLTFNQIEKDLAFIKEKRNLISTESNDLEITQSRKEQIVQDVQNLAKMLEENKQKLASLNKRLKESGVKVAALEKQVVDLNNTISARDADVASLTQELEKKNYEITNLNTQVASLETTKQQQESVISQQVAEIDDYNKAYYTLGTVKELKEKGLITKEGGFLGIGTTKMLNTGVSDASFSEIDIRKTQSIPVNSKEARLITEHPDGSYEFVSEGEKVASLAITNPDEFYKFSKYVVLEVH